MRLRDLLAYEKIVIQCHDNPDADALASGFGVYRYLKQQGKRDVRFVYSGPYPIRKSNLVLMMEELEIPIDYVRNLEKPDLLVVVDCQYGQGNVKKFEADKVVVIDHHQICENIPEGSLIESQMGSCSTIVWNLLLEEDYELGQDKALETALYYGLLTDTNNFTELTHPLDKKLRDQANYDKGSILKFRNSNLSLQELYIAGQALLNYQYDAEHRMALVSALPCDPNILGLISDLVMEVDVVDIVLAYSEASIGVKFSLRSCLPDIKANELAQGLAQGIGNGGGHAMKAGGLLQKELLDPVLAERQETLEDLINDYMRASLEKRK